MFKTFANAWRIEDIRKKILFTLFIVLMYRVGNAIPVPYVNVAYLQEYFRSLENTVLGLYNVMSGGAFSSATIFALSIQPYINSSIIIQLLCVAIPALERMQKDEGEEGRKKIASITRYVTVAIALLQGFAYYVLIRNNSLLTADGSGTWAAIVIVMTFTAGSALIMWLGEQITEFGVGNGISIILFAGIALIVIAIVCNGVASGKVQQGKKEGASKGITLAVLAGTLMAFFYRFVARAMDLDNFMDPAVGMATPYTAIVIFSLGVLISNFLFNSLVMRYPFVGERVYYREYFKGSASTHLVGMLGGAIWCLGTAFSYIASGKAGAAISYALGQGAPMIAAIWGVFVWKEFKGAGKKVYSLLGIMFLLFICGLALIILSGN
mgnify:CR=1 FL=1